MKLIKLLWLALFLLFLGSPFITTAQNSTDPTTTTTLITQTPKSTVATVFAGSVYAPNLHYFGRTDSLKSSALLPTILLQFDSTGIYGSGTAVFLNNNIQSFEYAGTVAEVGVRFGKQKGVGGNVYGNKFFYNTNQLPQSALKTQTGLNLYYQSKAINITGSGSAAFSDRTDYFTNAGLNKNIKLIKGKSVFVITPTAILNAGSQNFTNAYYKRNIFPFNNSQTVVMEQNRNFKILSYDFSIPVIWAYKNLFLIATPTYILPQNVIKNPEFPAFSENAQELFFVNITALYTFKFKKKQK